MHVRCKNKNLSCFVLNRRIDDNFSYYTFYVENLKTKSQMELCSQTYFIQLSNEFTMITE